MTKQAEHPSVKELTEFVTGQLSESQASDVERHIDICDPCSQTLIGLSTDDTFVGLLKQAGNPASQLTMGMTQLDHGADSEVAKKALSEHSRYEIIELIAQGGMGKVFKATHRMMDRTVALKVIKNELMRNAEVIERFHREVKAAAQLSHPNIVTAYDAEQAEGVHFLVMEYVEGINLADLVKRDGPLPIAQACDYARQAAAGLQHAHEQGMVHRDIKPHNLMLTKDGSVKILDFGLASLSSKIIATGSVISMSTDASLTCAGSVMGTPDFISPEQATDAHQADIRSDIYSLGATLYYLLSGQPPFSDGGVTERLRDHVETTPVPVNQLRNDVPQDLADVVSRMLAKDPAQRPQTPQEVENELVSLAVDHSPRTKSGTSRWIPRRMMALVGGTIAALLAGLIYIETDKGTLVIESDDSVKVTISKALKSDGRDFVKFRVVDTVTGSNVVRLPSGAYEVSLEDKSSEYKLNEGGFTLSRGGDVVVTVSRGSEAMVKKKPPALVEMPIPKMAQGKLARMGGKLSNEEARELQIKVDNDPNEIVSRLKLLGFYSRQSLRNADARKSQLELVRWFVQNYPEFDNHSMHIHASFDPEGYVEIKKRWLETIDRYPNNTKIIGNAANFLLLSDLDMAEKLLNKAQALEPDNPKWGEKLGQTLYFKSKRGNSKQQRQALAEESVRQTELAIQLSEEPRKIYRLITAAAKTAMDAGLAGKAKGYAEQLLEQADNAKDSADGIHHANIILGRLALQAGDLPQAKTHLLTSGRVPSSPVLMSFGPSMLLAKELLEKGETEVVLEYFELCGEFWKSGSDRLDAWEKTVKAGGQPDFGPNLNR